MNFLTLLSAWFGDPDPRIGTAWEKGERLAKLIAHRRTLLVLDGLEPLQNPPGPQEGRLREPSLQALLRELAAFNPGLCVITTRLPVADIADHERTSAPRRDLERLSSEAGAKLLRALGVKGNEAELRTASDEFSGHCLALTLLGSYLADAHYGDIRRRKEVSERLSQDVRQGVHARKVMSSYQTWFGEGPEISILRLLGLFDRPIDERVVSVLLKRPIIGGLTEFLTDLTPSEWRATLARLRRARLLAEEDSHNPGYLDTHPLVREYFGEQLRNQSIDAWKQCNRRLYDYYRTLAPPLPENFREMEPLFLAAICGCGAGLFKDALHDVYFARIQRGNASFAANVLGARGALLSVLAHFFEQRNWGRLATTDIEDQRLSSEDELLVLMQAAIYLTATRGMGSPEAQVCCVHAEPLCRLLNRPDLLYASLISQWGFSLFTNRLTATIKIAEQIYSLAQEQKDPALLLGGCRALACTLYFFGDIATARRYAVDGLKIWRSGAILSQVEELNAPALPCLYFLAMCEWHFGEFASCQVNIAEAISLAKELNDLHGLVLALVFAAILAHQGNDPEEVERFTSEVIEISTRQNFANWLAAGIAIRGWARAIQGNTEEGVSLVEEGIRSYQTCGSMVNMSYLLALKAEVFYLAGRPFDALDAINEAESFVKRIEEGHWRPELYRLRGIFLVATGAEKSNIEYVFRESLRLANEQQSLSLKRRTEKSYEEYLLHGYPLLR